MRPIRARRQISGSQILSQAAGIQPGERVLDLGCEGGAASAGILTAGEICFVSSDIRDIRLCEKQIGPRKRHRVRAVLADSLEGLPADPYHAVLYQPPQRAAKERVFEQIDGAFRVMRMGGRFCIAGRRDRGVESYRKRLQAVFGNATKAAQSGRTRVYRAWKKTEAPGAAPVETRYAFQVDGLPGGAYRFETKAGVFSRDGLDPGTRYLLDVMPVGPGDRVLDLGCGYGALGTVAGRLAAGGEAFLVDVDLRAVRCARANLAANGIENARAEVGDAFEGLSNARFDLIVSNPPLHEGNATAHPFIDGAAEHLAPDGRLMMVVMRPGPYRRRMQRVFARVEVVGERDGYTVLCAGQPGVRA